MTVTVTKIHAAVFCVEHLIRLGFRNRKSAPISFDLNNPRSTNLAYFTFHSMFWTSTIDNRGLNTPCFVYFVLHLPQPLVSEAEHDSSNFSSNLSFPFPSATTIPPKIENNATL